ncbi:MAG: phosphatidylserine decarboxylase [Faecousia sp.]
MQVWNRKELIETPEVGAGAMRFAYENPVGRALTKAILCRKFISKLYAAWQKSRFSKGKVRKFIAQYHIPLDDCTAQDFPNFNAFFTRQRKSYVNQTAENELPAIADSKLTALPIDKNRVFTVKGVPYTAAELLENEKLAAEYAGGTCLIFRLSPDDYHRYVYPDAGTQEKTVAIKGVLHSVNPIAGSLGVYRRNARRYTVLHTAHFGDVVQMEVGALLVGKIRNHSETPGSFAKLQEKGYFEYGGSTVILLLKKNAVTVDADILQYSAQGIETKVKIGERIAARTL